MGGNSRDVIEVQEIDGGVVLSVKAQPGAKRNAIVGEHAGMLKVAVTPKPENGKANEAILAVLAKQLGVAKSDCVIRSGSTARNKRIFVASMSVGTVMQRLGID